MESNKPQISDRAQHLLKVLIEKYIEDGQPVGSKVLARYSGLDLSSATIRNVMADLEALGLIMSPHTSAGRVPTEQGYRFFVDSLVSMQPLKNTEVENIRRQLDYDLSPRALMGTASDLLSEVTRMASIVMLPQREQVALRQIEFLPLSENRVLAIVVINECEVENRILHTTRTYEAPELEQAANYLNSVFAGKGFLDIRAQMVNELKQARQDVNNFMEAVVEMADKIFPGKAEGGLVVAGQANLLDFSDMADGDRLRLLFDAFKQKSDILALLDHCLNARGMQIFIGSESGHQMLDDCSLVASPYTVDGEVVGVLGVIGPTRMSYNRVIPIVDVTAKLVSAALEFKQ